MEKTTKYGEALSKTKGIRMTKAQLDLINQAGSADQWRVWMVEKARDILDITFENQGAADQWGGGNEEAN